MHDHPTTMAVTLAEPKMRRLGAGQNTASSGKAGTTPAKNELTPGRHKEIDMKHQDFGNPRSVARIALSTWKLIAPPVACPGPGGRGRSEAKPREVIRSRVWRLTAAACLTVVMAWVQSGGSAWGASPAAPSATHSQAQDHAVACQPAAPNGVRGFVNTTDDSPESTEDAAVGQSARRILDATGTRGGLVVHVGCGDGRLTAALHAGSSFVVHGLALDQTDAEAARDRLQSQGIYGPVSVAVWSGGALPYTDNLVQLLVADLDALGQRAPAEAEMLRVLSPQGVAYVKQAGAWKKIVKPRPGEIDEWSHFLHDANNNAVARDQRVDVPYHLQWIGAPRHARSHDHLASISALVSTGKRIFYIVDEGPIAAVALAPRWFLVARDAFSGVVLWKRPVGPWEGHLRGFRSGPTELARRLVAVGDRVYVTLGYGKPLCVLDAATGKTLHTYENTAGTLEVIYYSGTLLVVAGDDQPPGVELARQLRRGELERLEVRSQRPAYLEKAPRKRLLALEAESGRLLWKKADADTAELMPTTLSAANGRAFFQSPQHVICLDTKTGEELWRAARPVALLRPSWSAPTLVVVDDVVLSADRAGTTAVPEGAFADRKVQWLVSSAGGQAPVGELIAFSVQTGERLWSCPAKECYNAPVDVLVTDGLVWTGNLVRASEPGITQARDLKTGEVRFTRPADQEFFLPGMGHHRCYRNKATTRYLVMGRAGVELIDVATGKAMANQWVRATCQYGVMPCNGMIYAPPHSCACFIEALLTGFNCLAPKRPGAERPAPPLPARVEHGPAYGGASRPAQPADDWATYRGDAARSGTARCAVPAELKRRWRAELGGKLTAPVLSEGKVFVARVDEHELCVLNASTGQVVWRRTLGGRIDSPPTVWQGQVLFGCADGYLYCLRATDGALMWRFRAAPEDRRLVAFNQIESVWPVVGSVLVQDGVVWCVAGRSSYVDGGMYVCRLDARTGKPLSQTRLWDRTWEDGGVPKEKIRGTNMPGALPDVLSCDGQSVFLRHLRFDLEGRPAPPDVPHLFCSAGLLDDTWWHRTYWMIGTKMGTNYGGWPGAGMRTSAGRILVVDGSTVYGYGRNQYSHTGAHVGIDSATVFHFRGEREARNRKTFYHLFAANLPLRPKARDSAGLAPFDSPRHSGSVAGTQPTASPAQRPAAAQGSRTAPNAPERFRWTREVPLVVRAMVKADGALFAAGPESIEELAMLSDPQAQAEVSGVLAVFSPEDGELLARHELDSSPVFDGMAATRGQLYVSTLAGEVVCFGPGR